MKASDADAVTIRAEDGRSVVNCDISPFISNLPFGRTTNSFSTSDASGSTSQAANILEALEVGAKARVTHTHPHTHLHTRPPVCLCVIYNCYTTHTRRFLQMDNLHDCCRLHQYIYTKSM